MFTRPSSLTLLVAFIAALAPVSCTSSNELIALERSDETTASGVQIHDLLLGNGTPAQSGDWITVDYVARLTDRTELDSTYDRGQPIEFQLGQAPVEGWNEGLIGMKVGGRRSLVIPAHLAFGEDGVPGRVPPGATLVYEMELVAIRGE